MFSVGESLLLSHVQLVIPNLIEFQANNLQNFTKRSGLENHDQYVAWSIVHSREDRRGGGCHWRSAFRVRAETVRSLILRSVQKSETDGRESCAYHRCHQWHRQGNRQGTRQERRESYSGLSKCRQS